jgi:hypothetical protein
MRLLYLLAFTVPAFGASDLAVYTLLALRPPLTPSK